MESAGAESASLPLHPALVPLSHLLGRWRGEGEGGFPTINSFRYGEELLFSHSGKVLSLSSDLFLFLSLLGICWFLLISNFRSQVAGDSVQPEDVEAAVGGADARGERLLAPQTRRLPRSRPRAKHRHRRGPGKQQFDATLYICSLRMIWPIILLPVASFYLHC